MFTFFLASAVLMMVFSAYQFNNFVNPVVLFNFIWVVDVFLYSFKLSNWQQDIEPRTYLYLAITSISFFLVFEVVYYFYSYRSNVKNRKITLTPSFIDKNLVIWIVIEAIEVIYSGGFPITTGKVYSFGIPSLHGFANAYGLTIILAYAYLILSKTVSKPQGKIYILKILVMLLYFYLLLTRQVIIVAVIEIVFMYILLDGKVPWGKVLIVGVIGIFLFGIIGNVRTGYDNFTQLAAMKKAHSPLLTGFDWTYMYLVMTIGNLNKLFGMNITPFGGGYWMQSSLPTVISNIFYSNASYPSSNLFLVTHTFNVSGFSSSFYLSYGVKGLVIIGALYGAVSGYIYKRLRTEKTMENIILCSIVFQIVLQSFFDNLLLYLPVGFQLIITLLFFRNIRIKV